MFGDCFYPSVQHLYGESEYSSFDLLSNVKTLLKGRGASVHQKDLVPPLNESYSKDNGLMTPKTYDRPLLSYEFKRKLE